MARIPTAPVVAASLIGGYAVARQTEKRQLGGAVLAAGGAVAVSQWRRQGPLVTGVLLATYLGGFGASHPLAKKIGAWPSVLTVAGIAAASAYALNDRKAAALPAPVPA